MNLHAIPYSIPLILSGITLLTLAAYLYNNDRSLKAKIFTFLLFFVSFWSLAYALQIFSDQYSWIVFWAKIKYFGIALFPIIWLLFSLTYVEKKEWVNKKNIILISIIPCINLFFLFTNEIHYLFWSDMGLVNIENINFLYAPEGIFFWLNAIYSYTLIVVGSVLIIGMLKKSKHIYLKQAIAVLIGVLTPLTGSIVYVTGLIPLPIDYDITPMLFLVTGICFTFAIFRFQFLKIIPIAREQFFENVNDAVFIIGHQDKIVDLNKKAQQFAKENSFYSQISDIVGKDVDEVFSDVENYKEIFSNNNLYNGENLLTNGENPKYYDAQIISLYDKNSTYEGKMIILRDITDRKKMEEKIAEKVKTLEDNELATLNIMDDLQETIASLEKAEREIKELNEDLEQRVKERTAEVEKLLHQKDEFVNQLGHDLKNPLGPLLNLLPLIEEQETNLESKEMFEVINRNVAYMKNLVTKTIQLARLNAPSTELSVEGGITLLDEINKVIERSKLLFEENNITVESGINKDLIVKADKLQLEELFDNLIGNSIKYSPNDSNITIDAKDDGKFVVVSVKDEGAGMTSEQLDHVFEEFYKADESRHDFGSSGLGLSICKRIVEKHGGKIWVESEGKGKGTTIFFTIPTSNKKTSRTDHNSKSNQ